MAAVGFIAGANGFGLRRGASTAVTSPRRSSLRRTPIVSASAEYEAIKDLKVLNADTGAESTVSDMWEASRGQTAAVIFLTHFGDFSSWEIAQKVSLKLPELLEKDVQLVCIGLGSVDNARKYCSLLSFDQKLVFADDDGSCCSALGFSKGFAPEMKFNPYMKLLPMLAGIGSPGTIQEVLRGYVGDRTAKPIFNSPNQFDVLGKGYQRPFELATLRLSNMRTILNNWPKLEPQNRDLLTWQGGAIVFKGEDVIFKHVDRGILTYVDVDSFVEAAVNSDGNDGTLKVIQAEDVQGDVET